MTAYPVRLTGHVDGWVGFVFGWAIWGHFGVTVFIVLAGYSLTLGLAKREGALPGGLWNFFKRRALRIIPPYWAALTLSIILVIVLLDRPTGTHWDQSIPTGPKEWVVNALLLQDIIPVRNTAYTFWSVAVEFHIYLLLPVILFIWRRTNWITGVSIGAFIGIFGMLAARFVDYRFDRLYPEYYLLFALAVGACIARYRYPSIVARVPWLAISAIVLAIVVFLIVAYQYEWVNENFAWIDALVGVGVISFVLALESGRAPHCARVLSWAPLVSVAAYSYSLYLIHAPLLQVFWQFAVEPFDLSSGWQLAIMWGFAVPIMCVLSYGFYRLIEKRSVEWARNTATSVAPRMGRHSMGRRRP